MTSNFSQNRLQISVASKAVMNINITSALTELYKQVKESWVQDFYTANSKTAVDQAYKRRSPFIPFTLKNETGSTLLFTTLISDHNEFDDASNFDARWSKVAPGESAPFSFKRHGKLHSYLITFLLMFHDL